MQMQINKMKGVNIKGYQKDMKGIAEIQREEKGRGGGTSKDV